MKKVLLLLVLLLTSVGIWAQTTVAEVDWTQKSEWDGFWYGSPAEVSVEPGTGLIIDCNQTDPANANYWEPQVPIIQNIPYLDEDGQYQVRFTLDSPVSGELRLDLCSWDGTGATMATIIPVSEGSHEYWVDFLDYPTECTDAFLLFQCGKLPGKHIIKNVQVVDLEGNPVQQRHTYSVIGTIVGEWDMDTYMRKDGNYYTAVFDGVAAGCYEFKVRQDYDWTVSWPKDGTEANNCEVCVDNNDSRITIKFNPVTGEIACEVSAPINHTPGEPVDPSLFKNLADNKGLIAGLDYTGVEGGYPFWVQFEEYQQGTVECTADGIAINVGSQTGSYWQPQIMVIPEGHFDLEDGGEYKVVVTAKFPTSGTLQMNMGSWSCNDQHSTYVQSTGDFQDVEIDFPYYYCTTFDQNAHLTMQCGDFLGTIIIKKVEIYDLNAIPVDTLLYQSKEWAGVEKYPYYYSNDERYTATMGEEGLELYNSREGYWTPFATVFDGGTFIKDHNYKVVLTAKIPSDGYMDFGMGTDSWANWTGNSVSASDEFQEIVFRFNDWPTTCNRNGKLMTENTIGGTTIIKKVEIFDVSCDPVPYQLKDWTNCTEEDLISTDFTEDQGVTVEATTDGIAVTNPEFSSIIYSPQTKIINNVVLKRDHRYIVRVTAKIPSEGDVQINMRDYEGQGGEHCSRYVYPSDDFQDIDFEYYSYPYDCNGDAHILFQTGYIVGTTIIKKVEIFDMDMLTEYDLMEMAGKINVRNTQVLDFPETTDPNFKPEINLYSGDRWSFGRLTLNGYLSAISDISMWYDFGWATYYSRWYEDLQQEDNNREYFTSFVNNAATSIDNAKVTIRLYPQRWEFITLPFDVSLKDVKGSNGRPFVVRKYDGQKRAEGLLDETWVDMTENDILEAGVGYIWQTDHNNNYTDWYKDGFNTFTLRPVENASLDRVLGNEDVTVPLTVHKGEFEYNLGWNLIGNPYPSYFDSRAMSFSAPFIVWSNYHDNYEAFSPVDDAYILNPGQAFFVQSTEDQASITFRKEGRQSDLEVRDVHYGKQARQISASAERTVVNFTVSNGEVGDRTRVVINPEASLAYEADKDASKFASSEAKIQLYTIEQNVHYAINERPLSKGEVKLGMNCAARGSYTLTMRTSAECMVKLIDHLTGEEVMLANADTYTFESETVVFDNRFTLCFSSGEATGIQNFSNAQDTDDTYYDMQGRRISKPEKGIYIQNGKKVVVK